MITTRLRDTAFKRVLQTMPIGTPVKIEGPFGDLRLHHADSARPSCSPAASASRHSGASSSRRSETVACRIRWSSSTPTVGRRTRPSSMSSASWPAQDANLTFVPTMSALEAGSPGRASEATSMPRCSRRHLDGVTDAIYYLTGPPGMVLGLRTMLVDSGVDEDDIRTEEFTGY